jgi:hypothetical protein
MRRAAGLVAAVLLSSCADGSEGPAPTAESQATIAVLEGSWLRPLDEECSVSLRIDTVGGGYTAHWVCPIDENTIGDDIENGRADLSKAGQVTFQPLQASCPTHDHRPWPASYAVTDGELSLSTAVDEVRFRRLTPAPPYPGTTRSGCWHRDQFTDHPLQDL